SIQNNGHCNGKVIFGPGTDLSDVHIPTGRISDGDGSESNDIMAAPSTAVMPDVTVPAGAVNISTINGGSNNINGSMFIPAGTWVSFNGNGTVLHYDTQLRAVTGSIMGFRTKSWEEDGQ